MVGRYGDVGVVESVVGSSSSGVHNDFVDCRGVRFPLGGVVSSRLIDEVHSLFVPEKGSSLIESCRDSIVLFAHYMLGVRLYAWQAVALSLFEDSVLGRSDVRDFPWVTSRQIGKSTCLQVAALWVTVFNHRPVGMFSQTIVNVFSATNRQAGKLVDKIRLTMNKADSFMHRKYKGQYTDKSGRFFRNLIDPKRANNASTISFRAYDESVHGRFLLVGSEAGSYIESHPPTSGVLGETVSFIFLDEAGRKDKISDDFFYEELSPIGDAADAVRVYTSTPWEPSGFFFDLCNPRPGSSVNACVLRFTIDAIKFEDNSHAQTQYSSVMKRILGWREAGRHDSIRKSYYAEFVRGEKSFFSPSKVEDMFNDSLAPVAAFSEPCVMGVDFGGGVNSPTVVTIVSLTDQGKIRRLMDFSYPVNKDLSLLDDIAGWMKVFNVVDIVVDDCAAGVTHMNKMEQERGWTITRMPFKTYKMQKYTAFRIMLNKGLVESYEDDALRDEMNSMQKSGQSSQSVSCPKHGSDDLIDSFVIASFNYVDDEVSRVKFLSLDDY
jgi:hypothetical protein